jgi:predicted HAD superfamily hydrolase
MIRVCTFDVFDTTITRIVAEPAGIFHLLQRQLTADGAWPANLIKQFPDFRVEAERQARRECGQEETTLAEVYQALARMFSLTPDQRSRLAELELAEERHALRPVAPTIQLIGRARQQGRRVIFVSDSYLPSEFIREELARAGAWQDGDGLYVSSAHRVMKGSGHLFQRVLAQEGCAPNAICHFGDNPDSDVRAPRQLGLAVVQFFPGTGGWSA